MWRLSVIGGHIASLLQMINKIQESGTIVDANNGQLLSRLKGDSMRYQSRYINNPRPVVARRPNARYTVIATKGGQCYDCRRLVAVGAEAQYDGRTGGIRCEECAQ
jgi:hypothetical protein